MDEKTYIEKMNEVCKCGHSRSTHNDISKFEDGNQPPAYKKDSNCSVNNCNCEKFIQSEETE